MTTDEPTMRPLNEAIETMDGREEPAFWLAVFSFCCGVAATLWLVSGASDGHWFLSLLCFAGVVLMGIGASDRYVEVRAVWCGACGVVVDDVCGGCAGEGAG